jgi:iron complex transport system permease protein
MTKHGIAMATVFASIFVAAVGLGAGGWFDPFELANPIVGLRLRRVLAAGLCGGGLGIAGVLMQTVLDNEVADPYTLGLSSGAACGAVLSIVLLPHVEPGYSAALFSTILALSFAKAQRRAPSSEILVIRGLLVGGVFSALTGLMLFLAPESASTRAAQNWLFGGFHASSWFELGMVGLCLAAALVWVTIHASDLDRLLLGRDAAYTLGVDVDRLIFRAQVLVSLLAACAVIAGGVIGFVGWVSPHLARCFVGSSHRNVMVASTFLGASSLVVSDAGARMLAAPREIPVGFVSALLGLPMLVFWHRRRILW